jgi:hypothetical protein
MLLFVALLICFSVSLVTMNGCAQKKTEPAKEEAAPADSTQAVVEDTTVAETK